MLVLRYQYGLIKSVHFFLHVYFRNKPRKERAFDIENSASPRARLLSLALTYCHSDMIQPVLQARALLETQVPPLPGWLVGCLSVYLPAWLSACLSVCLCECFSSCLEEIFYFSTFVCSACIL